MTHDLGAQTYWVLSSTEVHQMLRVRLGYSADAYEKWLGDQLEKVLLNPPA